METQHSRSSLMRILSRPSPFAEPIPDTSDEIIDYLLNQCKVLVIGAGGLGCELLKDLAMMGIRDLHVIDMDTIELSNLNRQFLFCKEDIGKPKAEVAAAFIRRYVPDCKIESHFNKIQDFDANFYHEFNIVVCGLDSVEARRWINNMLFQLIEYDDTGEVDKSSIIPLVDGGTEGLKGSARMILHGVTACIECNLDLYPPPVNYPLCTLANRPRLPEHCVEYVKEKLWDQAKPFGPGVALDKDDPNHLKWIHERSIERAKEFNIEPPTLRFAQGVVKRTIPAVSSTNACVAAICAMETFKLITSCARTLENYQMINLSQGMYTYTFEAEKNPNCLVCGKSSNVVSPQNLVIRENVAASNN